MTDTDLMEEVRREAAGAGPAEERARRAAELTRGRAALLRLGKRQSRGLPPPCRATYDC
jgi:hypothetical protein